MDLEFAVRVFNLVQAGIQWLLNRGFARDRIQQILDDADGGDVDTAVVQAELDSLGSELDETEGMLGDEN